MYSLYRAWFGEETYPRIESLSPPDTVVRVGNEGEHQFVAHRGVLAAHSGYLKALLATTANSNPSRDGSSGVTSVSVSSVGGEAFAPLLNYMYTGRLEVTLENIYSVLLATHLLHMPGALEQCRAALLRLRGPPPPPPHLPTTSSSHSTTILRPVPNRLVGPPICWSQPGLYTSPSVALSHLPNLQLPPGLPVLQAPSVIHETATSATVYRENSPSPRLPTPPPQKPPKKSRPRSRSPLPKKEKKEPVKSNDEKEEPERDKNQSNTHIPQSSTEPDRIPVPSGDPPHQKNSGRTSQLSSDHGSTSSSGVVLDIACCDGPVKFHRVLNENYTTPTGGFPSHTPTCQTIPDEVEAPGENDENGRPDRSSTDSLGGSSGSGCYTCEYCQHTFKSHYCYKKHARRHLLPTDNEVNTRADGKRREVRLLDLNVQYYPCKICGSKFPSYYFVHKHKKMCHPNEERNSEGENSQSIPTTSNSAKT